MRELLDGLVDLHIHGSPSIVPRIETWKFLKEMDEAGYRAVCLKDHFIPTTGIAYTINHSENAPTTKVLSSVVLNNALGGLNVLALDAAVTLGARQVFMPTVSAKNHCEYLKTVTSFGGGGLAMPEKPIYILDKTGRLKPEVFPVVEYMKKHPELLFSMGHLSSEEIDVLLEYALSCGLTKIVVDHPYFIIGASVAQVKRWSRMGAYINFTCSSLEGLGKNGHVPIDVLKETLDVVPDERLLISTDFGQPYNGSPVAGMSRMIHVLLDDLKIPESRVIAMTHSLPAMLLGL
ncbi:MAG: DUF6282 family protein [Oscillospiraceae bacterium]